MSLSNVEEKALRLVADRRVVVTVNDWENGILEGVVRGDSSTYLVQIDPAGWSCACPNPRRCSHVVALRLASYDVDAAARWIRARMTG